MVLKKEFLLKRRPSRWRCLLRPERHRASSWYGEMEAGKPVGLVFFLLRFVEMSTGLQGLLRNTVEVAWRTSVHLSPELSRSHVPSSVASITFLSALHFTGSGCQGVSNSRLLPSLAFVSCEAFSLHSALPLWAAHILSSSLQAPSSTGWNNTWGSWALTLTSVSLAVYFRQPNLVVSERSNIFKEKSPLSCCVTQKAWLCWVTALGMP